MYSMKETCLEVGLSYQTLKYYCNQGLIPNVKRDSNHYRIFDDKDIAWIKSILCLKRCGMSIEDMRTYVDLCIIGKPSIEQRKHMLQKQKEDLLKQVELLQDSIQYIDTKQELYDDFLSGKKAYFSNIIQTEI
ncbi:MAG TPA: MerR family transcriptional regulator [Erysipelotrichaceae bacterium]|nr:MerR family transcriptional regulator [Erysipelotrichaceae bacterium]